MSLSRPNCPKCGAPCKVASDGLFNFWACPACHEKKKADKERVALEKRIAKLEAKIGGKA